MISTQLLHLSARLGPVRLILGSLCLLVSVACGGEEPEPPAADPLAGFYARFDVDTMCAGVAQESCFFCCRDDAGFDRSRYMPSTGECGCTYNSFDDEVCADRTFGVDCDPCCRAAYLAVVGLETAAAVNFNNGDGSCTCRLPSKTPSGS